MRHARTRRASTALAASIAVLAVANCGGSEDDGQDPTDVSVDTGAPSSTAPAPEPNADDPGAAEAGAEASPEAPAAGGASGELTEGDEEQVTAAVRAYIDALNTGDGATACAAFRPGGLSEAELPVRRGGCTSSLTASIGHRTGGGRPAWKRTDIATVDAVSVGGAAARVTATVNHTFSDRKYSSVEEDVVYLERIGGEWLILQPSATLYRAVGYPEPPLRAFTPPG